MQQKYMYVTVPTNTQISQRALLLCMRAENKHQIKISINSSTFIHIFVYSMQDDKTHLYTIYVVHINV